MHLAREIERRLERLVEGATAAVFRGRMHPVDIADRMVRQLEFLDKEGFAGPEIPNVIIVSMSPQDIDPSIDREALAAELAVAADYTAAERGWRTNGKITVEVKTDPSVPRGVIECDGTTRVGLLQPWGQLIGVEGAGAYHLVDNRITVGRAYDCDITIASPEVSRQHLLIVRSGGGFQASDLGSSNGTFINGARLEGSSTPIVPGDSIVIGSLPFGFRTV